MNQVAAETENVAIQITGNLKYQRDLLLTAETSVLIDFLNNFIYFSSIQDQRNL